MTPYDGWKTEYYTMNGGYPVPSFTGQIGKDDQGRTWYVRVVYRMESAKQEILFDFTEGDETPFLRDEVVNAEDYCKARNEAYHAKAILYRDFNQLVDQFAKEHGIK